MRADLVLLFTTVFLFLIKTGSFAQDAEDPDSFLKHQVGFNATESLRLFENETENTYKLNYRYKLNPFTALRSGINYRYNSSDNGTFLLDLKAGVDQVFKKSDKWRFYYGADLVGGVEKLSNSTRRNYHIGLAPFLGILFYFDEHFSVSTEPGLLAGIHWFNNSDSFNPDNSEIWVEMDLVNVGQIVISIHF